MGAPAPLGALQANRIIKYYLQKWLPVVITAYRNRRLACYTLFVPVIIYVCRKGGSTKRVFSKAALLLRAIFNKISL
jgi:hypothetical protein